jgi:hypothetical protein
MTATSPQISDLFARATESAVEVFTLWADANQKILRELVDLSADTAREGVRLYAELQSSAVEVMRDGQASLQRRRATMSDAAGNPLGVYQAGLTEAVDGAYKAFKLVEAGAQAVTRSTERLQANAEQTGKEIQSTLAQLAGRVKTLYGQSIGG